ncbi:thiamine phosphate synthase [Ruminococcus sp.]|uniref:thiamine phosphate synthase n=1 Tax=Ruminococcus sp. TaxID=41978 RepID=UPI003F0B850A
MFKIICVSARQHSNNFLQSIEKISKSEVEAIILREKDLSEEEYFILAKSVKEICDKYGKKLIIHSFIEVAKKLGIKNIQLPFSKFIKVGNLHDDFDCIGTSVHTVEDAVLAEKSGADYIIAGHIFATDCKKGLAPRGTQFLREVCNSVKIPVYAIGGIDDNSVSDLCALNCKNFAGVCVMSALMKSDNPQVLVQKIKGNYSMKTDRNKYLLYAVTDRHWLNGRTLEEDVELALKGGVTLVQLREKNLDFDVFCKEAEKIHSLCQKYNVPLIINDNVEVATAVKAEGVHLGQGDMSVAKAREILGNSKIIGATARTKEQAVKAEKDGADYVGSGAVFGTSTKSDAVKMSFETLTEICNSVKIPVTAIGGITKDNISELKGTDISGVAVVSGIFAEKDIYNSALELKKKIEEIVNEK